MKYLLFFFLICSYSVSLCLAQTQVIHYIKSDGDQDNRHEYYIKLLRLALDKGATDPANIVLKPTSSYMSQSRAFHQLINGDNIDVIWNGTSIEREKDLLPIRIPLIKGLIGYRVLVIHKKNQQKFSAISSIDDLKNYSAGQVNDWPDTEILRANHLKVVTASTYLGLFNMLLSYRFDYLPRGVNEAGRELEARNNPDLMINKHILLRYTFPVYFFVNKNNTTLATAIQNGLERAIADGSFDQIFDAYHQHEQMFGTLPIEQRVIIELNNPILPPLTPINNETLWYSVR